MLKVKILIIVFFIGGGIHYVSLLKKHVKSFARKNNLMILLRYLSDHNNFEIQYFYSVKTKLLTIVEKKKYYALVCLLRITD